MQIEASIRYLNGIAIVDLSGRLVAGQGGDALQGLLFQALDQGHPKLLLNCGVDTGGQRRVGRPGGLMRFARKARWSVEIAKTEPAFAGIVTSYAAEFAL